MIEVEVRGFQSIEHVTLKVEGFTALVGRTNIGKSAIVRAIKSALTNALGTAFVRHGSACLRRSKGTKTCKCESYVRLKSPDFDLVWRKGDAVNQYEWNGKTMTVPGRGIPEFLTPIFAPVKLGEDQKLLQIADQFFPIFLLDQSGSTVANILSDVARLDAVNVAMKNVEKDRREAISLRKTRDGDVADLTQRVEAYAGLDPVLSQANSIGFDYDRLEAAERTVVQVGGLCGRLSDIAVHIRALDGVDKITVPDSNEIRRTAGTCANVVRLHDRLVEYAKAYRALEGSAKIAVPDVLPLRAASEHQREADRLAVSYADRARIVEALDGVDQVKVPDGTSLTVQFRQWSSARALHERWVEQESAVEALDGADKIETPDARPLVKAGADVGAILGWLSRMRELRAWFDDRKAAESAEVPDVTEVAKMATTCRAMGGFAGRLATLNRAIRDLEQEEAKTQTLVEAAESELEEFITDARANGLLCPSCDQALHGDAAHRVRETAA